jgi:hypothetical protein
MPVKFPNRPLNSNTPNATPRTPPASTGHMSDAVRADTAKLSPELRAGILKTADAK